MVDSNVRLLSKAAVAMAIIGLLDELQSRKELRESDTNPEEAFNSVDELVERFLNDVEAFGFILVPIKSKDEILNGGFEKVEQVKKGLGLSYSEPAAFDPDQPIQ